MSRFLKKIAIAFYIPFYNFFTRYFTNMIIAKIPSNTIRKSWYRMIGVQIGRKSHIDMNCYILGPKR